MNVFDDISCGDCKQPINRCVCSYEVKRFNLDDCIKQSKKMLGATEYISIDWSKHEKEDIPENVIEFPEGGMRTWMAMKGTE